MLHKLILELDSEQLDILTAVMTPEDEETIFNEVCAIYKKAYQHKTPRAPIGGSMKPLVEIADRVWDEIMSGRAAGVGVVLQNKFDETSYQFHIPYKGTSALGESQRMVFAMSKWVDENNCKKIEG